MAQLYRSDVVLIMCCAIYFIASWMGMESLLETRSLDVRSHPTYAFCTILAGTKLNIKNGVFFLLYVLRIAVPVYRRLSRWLAPLSCFRRLVDEWLAMDVMAFGVNISISFIQGFLADVVPTDVETTCAEALGRETWLGSNTGISRPNALTSIQGIFMVVIAMCLSATGTRKACLCLFAVYLAMTLGYFIRFSWMVHPESVQTFCWYVKVLLTSALLHSCGLYFTTMVFNVFLLLLCFLEICVAPLLLVGSILSFAANAAQLWDHSLPWLFFRCISFVFVQVVSDQTTELSLPSSRAWDDQNCSNCECAICLSPLHPEAPLALAGSASVGRVYPRLRTAASRVFQRAAIVRLPQCRHVFHAKCFEEMSAQQMSHQCPMCRTLNERCVLRCSFPSLAQLKAIIRPALLRGLPMLFVALAAFMLFQIAGFIVLDIPTRLVDYFFAWNYCRPYSRDLNATAFDGLAEA